MTARRLADEPDSTAAAALDRIGDPLAALTDRVIDGIESSTLALVP